MIFTNDEIWKIPGHIVLVDGSFDPLHDGHIRYFQAAAELGLPVVCNVASDEYTKTKHPILLEREKRLVVLDSLKFVDFVYSGVQPTVEVLKRLKPTIYAKGVDWLARGGVPSSEQIVCEELGIEIRYLDLPQNSSSQLIQQLMRNLKDQTGVD